jgi:hypothetical protein
MWKTPVDRIQIEVPRRLFRAMHYRPLNLLVGGLTGVSVSFCPYFLYQFGEERVPFLDWRVLTCFAVTFLVPLVYIGVGAPVLALAWRRSTQPVAGADNGDSGAVA